MRRRQGPVQPQPASMCRTHVWENVELGMLSMGDAKSSTERRRLLSQKDILLVWLLERVPALRADSTNPSRRGLFCKPRGSCALLRGCLQSQNFVEPQPGKRSGGLCADLIPHCQRCAHICSQSYRYGRYIIFTGYYIPLCLQASSAD